MGHLLPPSPEQGVVSCQLRCPQPRCSRGDPGSRFGCTGRLCRFPLTDVPPPGGARGPGGGEAAKHHDLPPRRSQGTGARARLHVARCSGAAGRDSPPRGPPPPASPSPVPPRPAGSGPSRSAPRPAAPIARGLGAPGRGEGPADPGNRAVPCRVEQPSRPLGGERRPRERPCRFWRGSGPPPCCWARCWAPDRGGLSPPPSPASPSRTRRCPGTAASTTCWAG